jgi:hypothetical protein
MQFSICQRYVGWCQQLSVKYFDDRYLVENFPDLRPDHGPDLGRIRHAVQGKKLSHVHAQTTLAVRVEARDDRSEVMHAGSRRLSSYV